MNDCAHAHEAAGLQDEALAGALADAERRCVASGERLTTPRRRVLELLLQAGQPVKAYDLMADVGQAGESAKPPTVYRALEFLTRAGLAHRIESLNAYMACRLGAATHAAGFLICDCCHTSREVETGGPPELLAAGDRLGFSLQGVTIEGHGLCAECGAD